MSKINASSYFNTPSALGGYTISQSLRFGADTGGGYLSKTFGQNGTDWTLSAWVKRSSVDVWSPILAASSTGNPYYQSFFGFQSTGEMVMYQFNNGGSKTTNVISTAKFRDPNAWYHVVCQYDEGSNVTMYVNGEQVAQGANGSTDRYINKTTYPHYIGNYTYQSNPGGNFHGYMAEVHFVDGSLLEPEDFAVSENGIWLPKFYEGSHGTNGFYLPFDDSSDIGADRSGNDNDFAATTLVSTDVVIDTPANNFSVMNPLNWDVMTFAEGSLKLTTTSNNKSVHSTFAVPSSGKWIYEFVATDYTSGGGAYIGFSNNIYEGDNEYTGDHGIFYQTYNGGFNVEGTVSTATGYTTGSVNFTSDGDIHTVAIDMDNQKLYFAKNGTWRNSADPGAGTGGLDISSCFSSPETDFHACVTRGGSYNETYFFNFGQDSSFAGSKTAQGNTDDNGIGDFYYSVPSGFLALCSKNLPEPSISPINGEQPADYFDTILYTAATSNGTYTHGNLSFQPEFTWIKNRNNVERHFLIDVVRGNTSITDKFLVSSAASAEGSNGVNGTTFSVTSDGYEFVETSISSGELYFNGRTYVGWNWKAGGTAVSNTDGDITSQVSANKKAGFSIVSYTGNGSAATVGHGLDSAPEMYIIKDRDSGDNWVVYHKDLTSSSYYLTLDTTNAEVSNNVVFNGTDSTNSVFSVGSSRSTSGNDFIAYCFHSVPGYSKVGSYTGNGGSDGTYVHTGFRPAWVLVKNISASHSWRLWDNKRAPENVTSKYLSPDTNSAEGSINIDVDLLSNGFKMRNSNGSINASGNEYIYLAFSEQPFKYSNAR